MARIPYFEIANATGKTAETLAKLPPLNVFRMLAHGGELLTGFVALGNQLLVYGELDPVLREIAIIRVGVLCGASYEVQQHEEIGRRVGMSDELISAVHDGPAANAFDEMQRRVMSYTDDVVKNVRASDATFEPLRERLSTKALAELTICIGYYMMVSRFLETFDVDLETRPAQDMKLPGMAD